MYFHIIRILKKKRVLKKGFHFSFYIFAFLGVFWITSTTCYAKLQSEYSFKQISNEQGLPGYNVSDQIQDSNGIMWFCLNSTGLCRFDGHKYTLYNNNPLDDNSLSNDFVNNIIEDTFGDLWIATDYGLNRFNSSQQTFKVYVHNETDSTSISDNICNSLFLDSKGNIWVGTQNGLSVKEKMATGFKSFNFDKDKENNPMSILSISEQSNGIFWIGTNTGLIKFDPTTGQFKKWEKTKTTRNIDEPIHNYIHDILPNDDYLWLATTRGIDRFSLKTQHFEHWQQFHNHDPEIEHEGVNSFLKDKMGNIWVSTYTKGLVIIDPISLNYERISQFSQSESPIKNDHIRSLYEDNMGLIWIGTKFEGVFKFNENVNVFNKIPDRFACLSSLRNVFLLTFAEDNGEKFWIGTKNSGLYQINAKDGHISNYQFQFNKANSILSNRIQYIFRDSKHNLWIATENGLCLFDEKNHEFIKYSDEDANWILEDQKGTVWVGTIDGLFVLSAYKRTLERYNSSANYDFFKNNHYEILQIYQDKAGTLWFTTRYHGLHSYSVDSDKYTYYPSLENGKKAIKGVFPRSTFEDSKGNFWIGTKSGGLILYDRKSGNFKNYTNLNGLSCNVVFNMQEDLQGNIWLGTHNGISKFNPDNETFVNYNNDYGLKSEICEIAASYKFETGELLFGGNNGFNIFDPKNIQANDFVAPIVITSVKANDTELANNIGSEQEIFLNYKQNVIAIEFALIDYNNPNRHQYSTFMKGVDKNWKLLGNQNYISYANLKPGKYIFEVTGANEFGNWTTTPIKLHINISGPIYQRAWFRSLLILLIIALVVFTAIKIRKRENTLEKMIHERTRKLEVAYKELLLKNTKIREQNRQIERHQIELEQKVNERTRDLEVAKRKAEESDRLKSSFLANMSHEIRTPLNAITGFSALVSSDNYSPDRKLKYVNIIKTNAASLLKLVEDILDVSRIEAEQLTIKKGFFDFDVMLSEINATFQEEIKSKKNNQVSLICQQVDPTIKSIGFYSDEIRIRQILINLLSNAIKFTAIGKIELGYELKKSSILIWVRDTGIGIKEKDITAIFNRFTKIEEENAIYRGTGLGLSISQSLVNMLNGEIWVESKINVGSSFYFELPGELKIISKAKTIHVKRIAEQHLNLENRSLLVVEDDRTNFVLLQTYLMGTKARLVWVKNGEDALTHLNKDVFDLILLDFRISGIDAYETLKRIRNTAPEIPVIAQTAYASADEINKMLNAGFNNYLIKPFLKADLFEKLSKYLN